MKHTPGPWRADIKQHTTYDGELFPKDGSVVVMTDKGNFDIEIANIPKTSGGDGNYKANCVLIAAAPDLLRACKNALKSKERGGLNVMELEYAISLAEIGE